MSEEDTSGEKAHDPTPQRLQKAREDGDVAQSADLTGAAAMAGFVATLALWGPQMLVQSGAGLAAGLAGLHAHPDVTAPAMGSITAVLGSLMPLFLLPGLAAAVAIWAQRSFVVSPKKLEPKISRLSPIAGFGRRFGIEGLADFARGLVKSVLVGTVLTAFVMARAEDILGSAALGAIPGTGLWLHLARDALVLFVAIALVIGGADRLWQGHRFLQRNRMTRKQLQDEMKDAEGDPHMRGQRRQRAVELATNRMLRDTETADVVIVNPTHYAVALRWNRAGRGAPVCVAKGVDETARRIRERAAAHGVPIHSDPPVARSLHATVEIGDQIRPDHYRAVAAALRFADAPMKGDPRLSRLLDLSALKREAALGDLSRQAARCRHLREALDGLDHPATAEPSLSVTEAARCAAMWTLWADRKRAELNLQLARQTAEWLAARDAARRDLARDEALRRLAARLRQLS